MTPCTNNADCPIRSQCESALTINDPANPNVIKTGMAPEYIRCVNSIDAVPTDRSDDRRAASDENAR